MHHRIFHIGIGTCCALLALHLLAPSALAVQFQPLTAIPGVTTQDASLIQYINALFRLGIGLAAFIAVIRLAIAGIKYMGSDSYSSKSSAKEDIKEVFLGLLIILATVIILQTINPQILNLNILGPDATLAPPQGTPQPNTSGQSQVPWNPSVGCGEVGTSCQ